MAYAGTKPLESPVSGADADATSAAVTERQALQRRARLGVLVLVARTVVIQLTVLGGNVYLARLLDPADFGVMAIIQFALSFFALFGDAGLAAALIQQKGEPDQRQLSSVWWLQVLVSGAIILCIFVAAGFVLRVWPDMPKSSPWLLRFLAIELLLTGLRVIPAILLERELKFTQLAALDFVMTLVFYVVAVVMARMHYGVVALLAAALVQGGVGLVMIFSMRPWRPSLVMDRALLRPIVAYGVTYQSKHVIAFANGAVTPIYAGVALGKTTLGLNNWAQQTAWFPLQFVEIMRRAGFPLWSRLQGDRKALAESIERTIQLCAIVTLLFVSLFVGMGQSLIHVVFTDKWMPALPALYLYSFGISIGFLSSIIGTALDAIGRPQAMVRNAVMTTVVNWTVMLLVLAKWKSLLIFAALFQVHMVFGNLVAIYDLKVLIPDVRFFRRMRAPVAAAFVTASISHYALQPLVHGAATLVGAVVVAVATFAAVMFILDRQAVNDALAMIPRRRAAT